MAKMLLAGVVGLVMAAGAPAQLVRPPTAYSATILVTLTNGAAIYGKKVYRDGARMMVEEFQDTPVPMGPFLAPPVQGHRGRIYYNLDTHKWFGTDANAGPSTAPDRPASVSANLPHRDVPEFGGRSVRAFGQADGGVQSRKSCRNGNRDAEWLLDQDPREPDRLWENEDLARHEVRRDRQGRVAG